MSANPQPRAKGPISWQSVGLLAVVGGGLLTYYKSKEEEKKKLFQATVQGKGVGKPAIGGTFELIDHNGKARKSTEFQGKWMFIYFGFTYCPDICPNELMRMAEIITSLEKDPMTKGKVEPIFITIDPERDGPAQLKEYLRDWHPRMIGFTGSPHQIAEVCKKYRVYYSKARMGTDPMDYLLDHSIMFYLVDGSGEFVDYFGKSLTAPDIFRRIKEYVTGTANDSTHSDSSIGVRSTNLPLEGPPEPLVLPQRPVGTTR